MRIAARVLGALAGLLVLFTVGGVLLPGTWAVERSRTVEAPAEAIFPYLDSPARWDAWTPWEEMESTFEGPRRGEGATRRWADDVYGTGTFTIVGSTEPRRVRYRVTVEDGAMRTDGELVLEPAGDSTVVTWRENGDFGWNPLMGYVALTMDRRQGEQLEGGLRRLASLVEDRSAPGESGGGTAPDTAAPVLLQRPSRSSGGPGR